MASRRAYVRVSYDLLETALDMLDILLSWIEAQKHVPLCSGVVLVVLAGLQVLRCS